MAEPETSRRTAPLIVGAVAVVIVALLALLVTQNGDDAANADTPLIGNVAPAVTGDYADGTEFDLSRRKGSWVVLNFFADNCVPCLREHPALIEFVDQQRSLGAAGAEFYSIVQYGRTVTDVEAFFEKWGGDWPVVYDVRNEFSTAFGVAQVPETWVIDPNGIVRVRIAGEIGDPSVLSESIQQMREMAS